MILFSYFTEFFLDFLSFNVICGFPDIRPSLIYIISLGFHMILFLCFVGTFLDLISFAASHISDPALFTSLGFHMIFLLYFAFKVSDFLSFKIICGFPDFSQPYLHEISKISQDLIFIFCQ